MDSKLKIAYKGWPLLLWWLLIATFLPLSANAAGSLVSNTAWTAANRLDTTTTMQRAGFEIYGRYENSTYKLLLKSVAPSAGVAPTPISTNTTIWLNSDGQATTGYKIWSFAGGEEFSFNVASDGTLDWYRYPNNTQTLIGKFPVASYISSGNATTGYTLEIHLTDALLQANSTGMAAPSTSGIKLFFDVNDSIFLPISYSTGEYLLARNTTTSITRIGKRIGIVYSATSANRFWALKSYSQLFMAAQMQAVQAGIPFDLLTEDDLKNITKIAQYDALVFPYFANVKAADVEVISQNLLVASTQYKTGLIVSGNFMTNDENGNALAGNSYSRMASILGVTRSGGTTAPTSVVLKAASTTHPMLQNGYTAIEDILTYPSAYTDYFASAETTGYTITPVVNQIMGGVSTASAVLTATNASGARHVHFSTIQFMGDSNLLWAAMQWSVYGNKAPVALQLGREQSLFAARNDMDMSMYPEEYSTVEESLYTLINEWKNGEPKKPETAYNFVGSYYLNIGSGEDNWTTATNYNNYVTLYKKYLALGSEIGTHSYTHPVDTNVLTPAQIQYEFADSRTRLQQITQWGLTNVGGAVPGAPDNLPAANEMLKHVSYLSGGYSGRGAGFANAMGYLTPADTKVYLSPNMTFDFTNIEFLKKTPTETEIIWENEFNALVNHANQAVVHWPWHDYGPTIGKTEFYGGARADGSSINYTKEMFTKLIKKAFDAKTEFVTGADLSKRIATFRTAILNFTQPSATSVSVTLTSSDAGRYALKTNSPIASVTNWYAYNTEKVFPAKTGGTYTIQLGATPTKRTHVTKLPMRANLLSTSSTGINNLKFKFEGQGRAEIALSCTTTLNKMTVAGANKPKSPNPDAPIDTVILDFPNLKTNEATINVTCNK